MRLIRLIPPATAAVVALIPAAATAAMTLGPSPQTPAGWGSQAQAVGRYHLLVSQPAARSAHDPPGVFAFAVDMISELTGALGVHRRPVTRTVGELTVFMRKVKTGEPYAGSGILSVHSAAGNYVLYLTRLSSLGTARTAAVNQGAFVGPRIGRLSGHATARGHLTITVKAHGIPTLHGQLVRFSSSPTP